MARPEDLKPLLKLVIAELGETTPVQYTYLNGGKFAEGFTAQLHAAIPATEIHEFIVRVTISDREVPNAGRWQSSFPSIILKNREFFIMKASFNNHVAPLLEGENKPEKTYLGISGVFKSAESEWSGQLYSNEIKLTIKAK